MNTANSFQKLGRPRLLVVGDVILDRYTWGQAERVSPESPVMVLRAESEEVHLGGAAGVAYLLRALEAVVSLAGIVGEDGAGRVVRKLLDDERINRDSVICDPTRPTTTKERFMGRAANRRSQQVLRVDREERHAVRADLEAALGECISREANGAAAILLSDYLKGACTPKLIDHMISRGRYHGIPVLVDPGRIEDYSRYRGATLIAPNRVEAEMVSGQTIRSIEDAQKTAQCLSARFEVPCVVVKLDSDGLVLHQAGHGAQHFPAAVSAVDDVTGAGDMVLAVLGLACASGIPWPEAANLANLAAGVQVERFGVAPVSCSDLRIKVDSALPPSKIVDRDHMSWLAKYYVGQGKTLVFTNGCFDLLHAGHVSYLREAATLGDILIVALNSDESVRFLKGPSRPIIGQEQRAAILASLACVSHVVIFEETTPDSLLRFLRPHVLVKGGTYGVADVVGKNIVEEYGGRVVVTGKLHDCSTTDIVKRIALGKSDLGTC